jgi:hypothetical protein
VTLWAIRITGTGVAYRNGRNEFVWRNPELYLNNEFLERCNGLPVIFEHPDKATLNSEEFNDRIVGTCLLPFIPLSDTITNASPNEVWAVAKIYDDATNHILLTQQMSTSPGVVFRDASVNTKMTLDDGATLLIEGKPALLDHIAICAQGVWDKQGEPKGVENDVLANPEHNDITTAIAVADSSNSNNLNAKLSQISRQTTMLSLKTASLIAKRRAQI